MHSLWKDLLFLHGHLLHQQDLEWRVESALGPDVVKATAPLPRPAITTRPCDCDTGACA